MPLATPADVLDQVRSQWRALDAGGSRLVVVHAEPGTDTRAIVQELYRGLAAGGDDDAPSFWPDEMSASASATDAVRDTVRPTSPADPRGTLHFAWLGRTCSVGEDEPGGCGEVGPLVSAEVARGLSAGLDGAAGHRDRQARSSLLAFVRDDGADPQWQATANRVGRLPWAPVETRSQVLVRRLERFGRLGLPTVFALEDAHLAGEAVVALCRAVLTSDAARVLIVATADTRALDAEMNEGRGLGLLLGVPAGRHRPIAVRLGSGARAASRRASDDPAGSSRIRRRWDSLDVEVRRYLACVAALQGETWYDDQPLDQLPALSRAAQARCRREALHDGLLVVVDAWRIAFVDRRLYRRARDAVADLVPSAELEACRRDLFASISADVDDVTTWDALPPPVQATVLRTHCLLYPDPSDEELDRIGPEMIDSLDRLAGLEASSDQLADAMRTATRAVGLVGSMRRTGRFVDGQLAVRVQARCAYLPILGRDLALGLDDARAFTETMGRRNGMGSVEHRMARRNEEQMHTDLYDVTVLGWRRDHAGRTGASGQPERAAALLRNLVATSGARVGADDGFTLACRADLAGWLGAAGRVSEAVGEFHALLVDRIRVLGPDHPDTVTARDDLAAWGSVETLTGDGAAGV